jgi:hypothetical protein
MGVRGKRSGQSGGRQASPIRDVIDFYRRWPEFRQIAVALAQRGDLSRVERETVNWLVLLVDRIGEQDVGPMDSG